MATHFEVVACQAVNGTLTRDFKLYAKRSDQKDLDLEDHAHLRFWASKRVRSPLFVKMQELAEFMEKHFTNPKIDDTIARSVKELRKHYAADELDGMKNKPVFLIRNLPDGTQISYEIFESNY